MDFQNAAPFFLVLTLATATLGEDRSISTGVITLQQMERPDWLTEVREPDFGQPIVRIAGDTGATVKGTNIVWSRPARHIYSSVAAWDCSDQLLAIRNAGATKTDGSGAWEWLLLDGQNFKPLQPLQHRFVEFRWWNTRPRRMLLITPEQLLDYDPISGEGTPIRGTRTLFNRYSELNLASQGNLANDDSTIVLLGKSKQSGTRYAIAFSLADEKTIVEIPLAYPRVDYATISPMGKLIVVNGEFVKGQADRTRIYNLQGNTVEEQWDPYGTPSHYDLTIDRNGREIAVGVAKTALPQIPAGSVIARDLLSGEIRMLLRGGYAMHVSCRNLKSPGWTFVTYPEIDTKVHPPFSDELVAVRADGSGKFRRICRFRHVAGDYWAQPQACPNTRGSHVVFATNWRDKKHAAEACVVTTGLSY